MSSKVYVDEPTLAAVLTDALGAAGLFQLWTLAIEIAATGTMSTYVD
jgi:hypothetical protein